MTRQVIGALILGVTGVGMLLWLSLWQVQRLTWKQDVLSQIEQRISAPATDISLAPDPEVNAFQPVNETGVVGGPEIHILASRKQIGAGYRIISPFRVGDRVFLLDRGFVPIEETGDHYAEGDAAITVTGNLHWPDEVDGYTPEADGSLWFARDVDAMAKWLNTEPILIIARSETGYGIEPYPVNVEGIPNNHKNYAITWFSLAVVWFGMTLYLLWRIKRQSA